MTEAFLQAILESPDDDLPRLICADWLEDYAQPERAEFIRLQIALARLPPDHPARPALQTRERGLLLAHERDWTLGLRHLADTWEFRRGFADEVTVDRPLTTEQFTELFHWPVVRRLRAGRGWRLFPGLVNCPEARVLEEIGFANTRLTDRQFRDLVECPHFERLHTLQASNCQLDRRSLMHLARAALLGRLRALVLAGNNLGDSAAELVRSRQVGNLRLLDLSSCRLDREIALTIASAPLLRHLTVLRLGNNVLGDEECANLIYMDELQELNIDNAHVGEATWDALLTAAFPCLLRRLSACGARLWGRDLYRLLASPRLAALEVLDLSGSSLLDDGDDGAWLVLEASRAGNTPLDLDLSDLQDQSRDSPGLLVGLFQHGGCLGRVHRLALRSVADHGDVFGALLRSPHLGRLRALDVGDCRGLVPDLLLGLLESELMERLTALDLSGCYLRDPQVIELARHPNSRNLTWLSLRDNQIGSAGARALADSLHLGGLRYLDLSANRIDDEGAAALAQVPHLASPVVLNLADNDVGRDGAAALLRSAQGQFERSVTIPHLES